VRHSEVTCDASCLTPLGQHVDAPSNWQLGQQDTVILNSLTVLDEIIFSPETYGNNGNIQQRPGIELDQILNSLQYSASHAKFSGFVPSFGAFKSLGVRPSIWSVPDPFRPLLLGSFYSTTSIS